MTHTPTPAHQPGMTGGSMSTRRRAQLVVEVDLDPVPGWGNHVEDWRAMLQRHLDNTASHYRPAVTAPEATDPTPGEVGLTAEERGVLLEATHFSHRTCEHIAPAVERILAARTAARDAQPPSRNVAMDLIHEADEQRERAEVAEAREAELRATVERARETERRAAWDWFLESLEAHMLKGQPVWDEAVANRRELLSRAALTTPPTTEGGK